jgi:hypothetical protein
LGWWCATRSDDDERTTATTTTETTDGRFRVEEGEREEEDVFCVFDAKGERPP